ISGWEKTDRAGRSPPGSPGTSPASRSAPTGGPAPGGGGGRSLAGGANGRRSAEEPVIRRADPPAHETPAVALDRLTSPVALEAGAQRRIAQHLQDRFRDRVRRVADQDVLSIGSLEALAADRRGHDRLP